MSHRSGRIRSRRPLPAVAAALATVGALALGGCGGGASADTTAPTTPPPSEAPRLSVEGDDGDPLQVLRLPRGFRPEGIAADDETAYVGSLANGRIVALDLTDGGARSVAVKGDGTPSVGLHLDEAGRLWIAGGGDGDLTVADPTSGEVLQRWQLGGRDVSFINDVVVGDDAAYVTDSQQPRLFVVPLDGSGLPERDAVETVALGGEWQRGGGFGANGIVLSRDPSAVLVVNTTAGTLYRVPVEAGAGRTPGEAEAVDLDGADLSGGDGMVRDGRWLYVVRNGTESLVEVRLDPGDASGVWMRELDSPEFDVPTTVALVEGTFLLPNAKFGTDAPRRSPYEVVLVPQP